MFKTVLSLALSLCFSTALAGESKPLWDSWYTVTIGKGTKYGYYHERVELRGDRVFFQHSMWKQEEGFVNEEQLGAMSANNPDLTPMFFNFRSAYRGTERVIDGSVGEKDRMLTVKVREGDKERPLIKKSLPKNVIFSQFFPVWIGLKKQTFSPTKVTSFSTILEDNLERAYTPVSGRVTLEKTDEFAKKSGTTKLKVIYDGDTNYWYVDAKGAAERIEMPKQSVVISRVTQEAAEKFLAAAAESKE
jgi:hypothetical protein